MPYQNAAIIIDPQWSAKLNPSKTLSEKYDPTGNVRDTSVQVSESWYFLGETLNVTHYRQFQEVLGTMPFYKILTLYLDL